MAETVGPGTLPQALTVIAENYDERVFEVAFVFQTLEDLFDHGIDLQHRVVIVVYPQDRVALENAAIRGLIDLVPSQARTEYVC